jgi:site-specific DNA-methyltransferase (adenine-specific)
MFKYDVTWVKTIGSGQLNIHHQPLRLHENVLVFYNKSDTYNPQMSLGKPYSINRKVKYNERGYGEQKDHSSQNTGFRHPTTVLHIPNPRIKNGHPTQKPIMLMEYFIKTYTNEGDIVLDPAMGSGTTGVACMNTGRDFIGIEIDKTYFDLAKHRIEETLDKPTSSS